MGHKSSKNKKKQPEEDIQDMILGMRLTSKQFQNAAKRAQKDQEKEIKKAREALKKSNEEGAKLFLQNAANKYKESQSMMKMAHRMDAMSMNIQHNTNNTEMMKNLSKMTPMLMKQQEMMNPETMSNNLKQYQDAMDSITIAGRIMDMNLGETMSDQATDTGVEGMMENLKQEIAMELNSDLAVNSDLIYNNLQSRQKTEINTFNKK